MRYKYIELQNYFGIYDGMGLDNIKIDFTLCKSNKIIIIGDNGSGKSTLMNAISPLPEPNTCFLPKLEGGKVVCIDHFGIEYIIRYIHPITSNGDRGTTKGYISKCINGEMSELNPNGNISSCKEIIFDEFDLDPNFLALSQLGTESRGLAYMLPSARKKLVSSIIAVLATYNDIYKTLNNKTTVLKSTINSLVYKIDSIGDATTLQLNLANLEGALKQLEENKNKCIETIASLKVRMNDYIVELQNNNYDAIVSELNTISKDKKILFSKIDKVCKEFNLKDYTDISDLYGVMDKKYIELETDIEISRKQIPSLLAQRESEYRDLENKRESLNALQSDYNYMEVKKVTEESRSMVEEYDKVFNKMGLMDINIISKDDFDTAMESFEYLLQLADVLSSSSTYGTLEYVYENREQIKSCISKLPELRKELSAYRDKLSVLEKEALVYETKRNIASELSNRPKGCKIDDCPYIKSAIEADRDYPDESYKSLVLNINSIKEEIESKESLINSTEEYTTIISQIDNIEYELRSKIKFITKLPVRADFADTFIMRVINNDRFEDIHELYKYVDCGNMIEEYKIAKQNLREYDAQYKLYESKNIMIESIMRDIDNLQEKTTKLANDLEDINNSIADKERNLSSGKIIKDKLSGILDIIENEYTPCVEREKELICLKESLDNNKKEIDSIQVKLSETNNLLGSINNNIQNVTNQRDQLKHSSVLLEEYKQELDAYNNKYTKIDKIKYYASPSKGIQTLFMKLYMNKILNTSNELLSLLFSGAYTLMPFDINSNEFRIPCVGNGLMHDDISSMSTAQKCMISMIISFSLLNQSSTKYNILRLDEIDGGLDTNNRAYFITLLDNLMNMLECEQCFIISHNNEINTSMCDLIILKTNANNNYDGNIIWKY